MKTSPLLRTPIALLIALALTMLVTGCVRVEVPEGPTQGANAGLPPTEYLPESTPESTVMTGDDTMTGDENTPGNEGMIGDVLVGEDKPGEPTQPYPYDFYGIEQWFNLEDGKKTLSRAELEGKVVLVDFWTYSCINCIRTFPYLTSWDEKYRDDGLVIVGIHSPEFAFEKDPANVAAAIKRHGINYPVGLDNDFVTWRTYGNRYWPHIYVFNRDGQYVYDHIGEGGYQEIEAKLKELLGEEDDGSFTITTEPAFKKIGTPELYLGHESNRGNIAYDLAPGEHVFTMPPAAEQQENTVYLSGTWTVLEDSILAGDDAQLSLRYNAKDVHIVAGGKGSVVPTVDDEQLTTIIVDEQRLYTLASTVYGKQTLHLAVSSGVEVYTFTFG